MKNGKKTIYKLLLAINFVVVFFLTTPLVFADDVSINLRIETPTETIFNGPLNVTECTPLEGIASSTSAYCAIVQSGATTTWSAFGDDYFLDSINGVSNDFGSNLFWLWFSNLELGSVSMNKRTLTPGENLLIAIGKMPMKIEVSTTTPLLNSTTTISLTEFGFDSSFNPIYSPSASSTLIVDGNSLEESENGVFDIFINSTSTRNLKGTKSGFIDTAEILLMPYEELATSTVTSTEEETSPPPPAGSGGGGRVSHLNLDLNKAIQFLISNQKEDGSFGNLLYTDWAAIALASTNEENAKLKLKNYFLNNLPIFSVFPDYERHAMAMMSLGINPYNGTSINYIREIGHRFDGAQMGDKSLVNDDIFAIFPLFKSGFGENDPFIKIIISFIISKQQMNGSWEGSVDLTASAIQALSLTPSISGVNEAKTKARLFLKNTQQENGGWGNSFSTSWVMQAISALGENRTDWNFNGNDPGDYIFSLQAFDGGVDNTSTAIDSRIWATSYAIVGAQGKTWGSIMQSFEKQVAPSHTESPTPAPASGGGGGGGPISSTQIPDTTLSTSTEIVASTTENLIVSSTTVATSTQLSSTTLNGSLKPKNANTPKVNKNIITKQEINKEISVTKPPLAAVGTIQMPTPLKTAISFLTGLAVFLLIFI
ncbi:MAG: prenyltransferase/squalene oxidase repeat-containing protein [Patescibacteria group bacterium]